MYVGVQKRSRNNEEGVNGVSEAKRDDSVRLQRTGAWYMVGA